MGRTLSSPLQESVATQFYSLNFAARFVISKCLKVKIGGVCATNNGGGRKFGGAASAFFWENGRGV